MNSNGRNNGSLTPALRWRTIAGFIILLVSLIFFMVDAYAVVWWDTETGLQRPAWALLAVSVYFFFGVWIPAMLQQRRDDHGRVNGQE